MRRLSLPTGLPAAALRVRRSPAFLPAAAYALSYIWLVSAPARPRSGAVWGAATDAVQSVGWLLRPALSRPLSDLLSDTIPASTGSSPLCLPQHVRSRRCRVANSGSWSRTAWAVPLGLSASSLRSPTRTNNAIKYNAATAACASAARHPRPPVCHSRVCHGPAEPAGTTAASRRGCAPTSAGPCWEKVHLPFNISYSQL